MKMKIINNMNNQAITPSNINKTQLAYPLLKLQQHRFYYAY